MSIYKLKSDIVFSTHSDGSIVIISLFDSEQNYLKINGLSQKIFLAISSNEDLSKVKKEISLQLAVEEDLLEKEVENFILFLESKNIIEKI